MDTVTSRDGTRIAYDRIGDGAPLILVADALQDRKHRDLTKLANLLSHSFTVFNYDRRGRGDSDDVPPYAPDREVDDLNALIDAAGGSAHVWGKRYGAALALRAAAAGSKIHKLALQEPPFAVRPSDHRPPADFTARLSELVARGERGAALRYFLTVGKGMQGWVAGLLRLLPGEWSRSTALAHTLPYDAKIVEAYQTGGPLPLGEWDTVSVSTLVISGTEREGLPKLVHSSAAVANALPNAELVLRSGSGNPKTLTPANIAPLLTRFFST